MLQSALLVSTVIVPLALATASSKRGLIYIPSKKHPTDDNIWSQANSDLTWYYNYGVQPTSAYLNSKLQFVPMLWGVSSSDKGTSFSDAVKSLVDSGQN